MYKDKLIKINLTLDLDEWMNAVKVVYTTTLTKYI